MTSAVSTRPASTRFASSGMTGVTILCLAVFAIGTWGCASTPEPAPAPPAEPTGSEFDQGSPPPASELPPEVSLDLAAVYFDFDRSEIRQDARRVLRSNAETLKQADANITIEGHCDERGNEEYNLALGDRRASAVKKYLVNVGVSGSRMRTISYGESKPAVSGHDESAWRWNRSTQFRTNR